MRTITVSLFLFVACGAAYAETSNPTLKPAVVKAPAESVSREERLILENARLKMELAEAAYWANVEQVARKYNLDLKAGDDVNFQTGEITRKPRKPDSKK